MRLEIDRHECEDMVNIVYAYVFIGRAFKFGYISCKYDGLPVHCLWLGLFRLGWGLEHEWEDIV